MDWMPFTGFTGMLTWEETLVNDCVDVAGPLEKYAHTTITICTILHRSLYIFTVPTLVPLGK
jgi:hypothetical protein